MQMQDVVSGVADAVSSESAASAYINSVARVSRTMTKRDTSSQPDGDKTACVNSDTRMRGSICFSCLQY